VKRIRDQERGTERKAARVRPKLQLIRGGALGASATGKPGGVRQIVIERARSRLARGYYERPSVQRRLVDTLWEELFAEV